MAAVVGEDRTAKFCMTVIGVGYLFPISAIWAAFDYWKLLFPHDNIEFVVTGVYQVGSMATVAALSVTPAFSMGPRIIGGFAGQFACLAVIFCFRWLTLDPQSLLHLLLLLVLLCSVTTGYLDSALLSLCSQYSPRMQQYLQIGIGLGTMVSVTYRDATKLLLRGDISTATSCYFLVALVTVQVCLGCYRLLMALPCSKHIRGLEKVEMLLERRASSPPASPLPVGFPAPDACDWQRGTSLPELTEEVVDAAASACKALVGEAAPAQTNGGCHAPAAAADGVGFASVFRRVWRNQLAIFLNLLLTTWCYPGLITSIPCRDFSALAKEQWFQTLLLTAFTVFDIAGRFLTHLRFGLHHGNVYWTVVVRAAVSPLVLFCIISPAASDVLSALVVGAFGLLNGYCVSMSLIVPNEIPGLSDEQRATCGRISACSVNSGLCVGAMAAALTGAALGLGA